MFNIFPYSFDKALRAQRNALLGAGLLGTPSAGEGGLVRSCQVLGSRKPGSWSQVGSRHAGRTILVWEGIYPNPTPFPEGRRRLPAEAQVWDGLPPALPAASGPGPCPQIASPGKPLRGCQRQFAPPGLTPLGPLAARLAERPGGPPAPRRLTRAVHEATQLEPKGGGWGWGQAQGGGL